MMDERKAVAYHARLVALVTRARDLIWTEFPFYERPTEGCTVSDASLGEWSTYAAELLAELER